MASNYTWPVLPYKGISYFTREDEPLFAGRQKDAYRCAREVARSSTRALVLHGLTGCGKSSFLRAGLIPFLESHYFKFPKEVKEGGGERAFFIPSTDAPLSRLSEYIFDFATRPYTVIPPDEYAKPFDIRLDLAIEPWTERRKFVEEVGGSSERMIEVIKKLAALVTYTPVIVIDQGEEVMTLNPGQDGDLARDAFFDFLVGFSRMSCDFKLIVAIRTEFHGRFSNGLSQRASERDNIQHFYLEVLRKNEIVEAIERPTSRRPIGDYGVPYEHYHFSYAGGLADKIAGDLLKVKFAGGVLPAMQIVCDRLYKTTRDKQVGNTEWVITESDYDELKGIEGIVEDNLEEILLNCCKQQKVKWHVEREIERWLNVLGELAEAQYDGTITTKHHPADYLNEVAETQGCRLDFKDTMSYLAQEEQRIVQEFRATNPVTQESTIWYRLGHDVIGLVLQKWKLVSRTREAKKRRMQWAFGMPFRIVFFLLSLTFSVFSIVFFVLMMTQEREKTELLVTASVLAFFAAAFMWAAAPDLIVIWQKAKALFAMLRPSRKLGHE